MFFHYSDDSAVMQLWCTRVRRLISLQTWIEINLLLCSIMLIVYNMEYDIRPEFIFPDTGKIRKNLGLNWMKHVSIL